MRLHFPKNVRLLTTPKYLVGGASTGNYTNFNLATHTNDNLDAVIHNRQLLVAHFNLPAPPKWLNQTHSNICLDANSYDCEGDCVITREKGVVCAIMTADCLPIFASNLSGTQVGVAHAGWQGILNGVIESFIQSFDSTNLIIHFGPAISVKNLEIGNEVFQKFIAKNKKFNNAFIQKGKKYYLDIYQAARIILSDLGIKHTTGGEQCTAEQKEKYFSYRREGVNSGRMAHLIWMHK